MISLKNSGKTIIFIEHNLDIVLELADRLIILERGNIVFNSVPERSNTFKELLLEKLGLHYKSMKSKIID